MARAKGTGNHGVKISWTADNDRKLLLSIIDKSKKHDVKELVALFPGGTTKALEERIAKLKRESNALLTTIGIDTNPTPRKRKADNDDRQVPSPSSSSSSPMMVKTKMKKKRIIKKSPSPSEPVKKQEDPASLYYALPPALSDHTDVDGGDSDDGSVFVKYE